MSATDNPRPKMKLPRWPRANSSRFISQRQEQLRTLTHWDGSDQEVFEGPLDDLKPFQECLTGKVTLPVGVVGPLELHLTQYTLSNDGKLEKMGIETDSVYVPLAHTEGGLTASVQRGVAAVGLCGGVRTYVLADRITRDTCFVLSSTEEAIFLANWLEGRGGEMADWLHSEHNSAESTRRGLVSKHAKLQEVQTHVLGTMCHVLFRFTTGDACGPNMMTRNAYALAHGFVAARFIAETGIEPARIFLEANMGGDKKPSHAFFQYPGHGKVVHAEISIPRTILRRVLRVDPSALLALEHAGMHGAHASGMQSFAFTPASVVAAIYAATGQDLGMVGTSSMAQVSVSAAGDGVHFSMRFSGLEVGTIGGGTSLPHAASYLKMLDCWGEGKVYRFAQIIAATAICLELSASASMATQGSKNFVDAHLQRGGLR